MKERKKKKGSLFMKHRIRTATTCRAISVSGGIMPGRCLEKGDTKCPSMIRHSLCTSSCISTQLPIHNIFTAIIYIITTESNYM